MTIAQIKALAQNEKHIYGFRMTSGKEIILAKTYRRSDIDGNNTLPEYEPEKFVIDDSNEVIKVVSKIATPMGPQIDVLRYIDIDKIAEVMMLYNKDIDGPLQ